MTGTYVEKSAMEDIRDKIIKCLDEECFNCRYRYYGDADEHVKCMNALLEDLLGDIETEMPKLYKLDELQQRWMISKYVWLQYQGYTFHVKLNNNMHDMFEFTRPFDDSAIIMYPDSYGKTWQCWTAYPSDRDLAKSPQIEE